MEEEAIHFIEAVEGDDIREIPSGGKVSRNEIRHDQERRLMDQISAWTMNWRPNWTNSQGTDNKSKWLGAKGGGAGWSRNREKGDQQQKEAKH